MLNLEKLNALKALNGATYPELGELLGVSESHARWLFVGKREMKASWLKMLAEYFGVGVNELYM